MIPVLSLIASLRYGLQDMQGVRISDFELIELINQAAAMLYSTLSERYVHAAMKTSDITVAQNENNTNLPSDFVRVHQVGMGDDGMVMPTSYQTTVEGTYRIINNKFYATPGTYKLEYYYVPERVSKLNDNLDAPLSMSPYIERIALLLYGGRDIAGAKAVADLCTHTLSDGEISRFADTGPAMILGGKI